MCFIFDINTFFYYITILSVMVAKNLSIHSSDDYLNQVFLSTLLLDVRYKLK